MKQFTIQMLEPQGYCGGVLKAIQIAKNCRLENQSEHITILGNLVHNKYVQEALQYHNIETVDVKNKSRLELLDLIDSGIVIFTAHGVSSAVFEKARKKGLKIIDATCPFVSQTQKIVKEYLEQDFIVFYIGKKNHPEAQAIYEGNANVYLIESTQDIPSINSSKIFVTNQTTMSILDIQNIFDEISKKYPTCIIHDEICNATRIRQQAILNLKNQGIDTLIVVGDPTSNNTSQLANIGKIAGIPQVIKAQSVNDIDLDSIKNHAHIAITSGASTPSYLTNMIYDYLNNQGEKEKIRIENIL
ncbi:4-hydroxy-3-methylbut-2-enyl diphosphate reductase [Floccifex sp.]|uniref:4-hydroxy-3-methylbut-2-enyl diphosphate reductase n=1 Tax=Floccifex sp. TaxID=2815810 RepID=UPI002A74B5AB|nr:4-hydroxy-3-methylbut-2-enyl diphosphate reductase [Floccifex sp.]MDD7281390.1 4-hydroxy-3-methylbut-2-enyl diphosphate reductase [Erysipelotrichaceae bacterium]MDY2958095.1 4-hydroxy-3-methylbut-2-enyl diphosphate reductase [Floccifex sp.]